MGIRLKSVSRWFSRRLPWRRSPELPPTVPRAELWPKVHDLLVKEFNVPASSVSPKARFMDDLGIDSMESIQLLMAVEEKFSVEISDEEAEKLATVADLLLCLEEKLTDAQRPHRG